eukprot:CAMPEP_0185032870 /NCGR_PEP_ID=MMETSP1103-20130426/21363_1 /TAXON_ID=36769 /ORGANISM="Paraphysomonas bandaiensis, Strain Caron Lab Isolate" /LENGTH=399 /DNA_ID=CAMNT_0027568935 /DNA_START=19 /DNA_END=1215 /DNA_ORIENTATION=+
MPMVCMSHMLRCNVSMMGRFALKGWRGSINTLTLMRRPCTTLAQFEGYFKDVQTKYQELESQLTNLELSPTEIARLSKEYSILGRKAELIVRRAELLQTIQDLQQMEDEERKRGGESIELAEMALAEIGEAREELLSLEEKLISVIMPRDEADEMGIVLEVRAGTGGEEASLFASQLYKMYEKYCSQRGWRWEQMSLVKSDIGGFTLAQANIKGDAVFERMKFESGVHRVQRVPVNDVRIQTSAASVIVLPEPTEVEIDLRPQDIRVDLYRSQGAGGQSVNTTDSAVRLTHLPTGVVVTMQDERSQVQNKLRAMQILRSRVYDLERSKQAEARAELRSAAQGTGDRSDKIRTYNFPQDRITDHRIGLSTTGIERVLSGETLDTIISSLIEADERERLAK